MNLSGPFLLLLPAVLIAAATGPVAPVYRSIPLPGIKGRIDHMDIDTVGHRLFVAALGNGSVEVLDLAQGKAIRSLRGFSEPQGIAYLAKGNRIAIADGDGSLRLIDGASYRIAKTVDLHADADNVRYESGEGRLYVGYGSGGIAVMDPDSGIIIKALTLPSHPEAFRIESQGKRLFVNVPGANEVEVVDRGNGEVLSRWASGHSGANYPMALDGPGHRLFVGVRRPSSMKVFDTETGKIVADVPTDGDADDIFLDPQNDRVILSCGAGFVDLIPFAAKDRFGPAVRIPTAQGARTSLFLPKENRLYLAVPARGAKAAEIRIYDLNRIGP